jgi:hypothetical protein
MLFKPSTGIYHHMQQDNGRRFSTNGTHAGEKKQSTTTRKIFGVNMVVMIDNVNAVDGRSIQIASLFTNCRVNDSTFDPLKASNRRRLRRFILRLK